MLNEEFNQANWDSQFVLCWWILAVETFYLAFELEPIAAFSVIQWVWVSIQFKGLANHGAYHDLDGTSSDTIALATSASMDVFGEGTDEFDSVISGYIGEHGVHSMERFNEAFPMVPVVLPFHVRCCHDTSVDALPFSSEKMHEVILMLWQKPCHK